MRRTLLASVVVVVLTACSQPCADINCEDSSVSITLADAAVAAARICIDDDCELIEIEQPSSSTGVGRSIDWNDEASVEVTLELLGPDGESLATLVEQRTMFDPQEECRCAGFGYRWRDGELTRFG